MNEKCEDCPLRVDCLIEDICLNDDALQNRLVERLISTAIWWNRNPHSIPGEVIKRLSPRDRKIIKTLRARHFNHRQI
jgi:hypothetical protein